MTMSELKEHYKVILIDAINVGKNSIITQFIKDEFNTIDFSSSGSQFVLKNLEIVKGKYITFEIWDSIGQEKNNALSENFYKDVKAIILVYDCTNKKGLEEIKNYWYKEIIKNGYKDKIVALISYKNDLSLERQVGNEEGESFAKEINVNFISTSAKNNNEIQKLFKNIGLKILNPSFDISFKETPENNYKKIIQNVNENNSNIQDNFDEEMKLDIENLEEQFPVSNFQIVKMEDISDCLAIPKNENELNDFVSLFDKEIDDYISLENINKIIVNSNFNLKILNQKLKEYSDLKGLFLYFSKSKKKSLNEDKKEIVEKSIKEINSIDIEENPEEKREKSQSYFMIEESLIKEENKVGLESGFLEVFVKPKLIEKEDELIEGKEYEIKVRKYFKIYLDYCTNQVLQIETNQSSSFNFLYNALPQYVKVYDSVPSNNIVEFDILVKGITKSSIINLINNLKSCIMTYYGIENLEEDKYYDIIGEVAKNIINQSVEKIKQVRKYIDIICIDKELRKKLNKNNIIFTENYKNLNLGAVNDKILMLFTDGSYLKLKYACNKIIQEKVNLSNFSFNEKIFDNRDQKNIKV